MIDINTLHIGSHILIGGERREVFGLGCGRVSYLPHPLSSIAESVLAEDVEPIPITEELLTELGFEKISYLDNAYTREFGGEYFMQTIHCTVLNGKWNAGYSDDDNISEFIHCQYLHELEQYVYKTTKTELIKE